MVRHRPQDSHSAPLHWLPGIALTAWLHCWLILLIVVRNFSLSVTQIPSSRATKTYFHSTSNQGKSLARILTSGPILGLKSLADKGKTGDCTWWVVSTELKIIKIIRHHLSPPDLCFLRLYSSFLPVRLDIIKSLCSHIKYFSQTVWDTGELSLRTKTEWRRSFTEWKTINQQLV